MNLQAQLLAVADAFGRFTNRGRKRVSTMVFNQGGRLDDFATGAISPTVRSIERGMQWFSDNWPEGAEWPEGIARPQPAAAVLA